MNSSLRLIIFLLIIPWSLVHGQDPDLKEVFLEAESYFLFEEYNEALPLYLRLHRADPGNDNVNYKIGVCFLNDPYQKDKSIRYLLDASENTNPDFKINKYKERTAPLETFFYLGKAYLVNNEIENALESFMHFREILDEDVYDVQLVEEQIAICHAAMDLMSKPVDFDKDNLGEPLNSRFADIHPIVSGDGNRLVYVAKLPFYDATYFTEKIDGEWLPPRNIIPELGVDGDVYPTCLSDDGNTMIIYRNDDFIGNLYMSTFVNGRWTAMEKLGGHISTKYWESHGCLSMDGKTLYFTSNRKGGYGGLDIYRSELQADGQWGEPVNLGPNVNTRYNEETPFITRNGRFLFFSSYGHYNMGGYDIFMSMLDEDGKWAKPVNLGYPINTTDDDIFYQPVDNGNGAYYSLYSETGFGRHDLYYLEVYSENNPRLYLITGSIFSDKGLLTDEDNVRIYLIDQLSGDTTVIATPDLAENSFRVEVPRGKYNIVIRSDTHEEITETVEIDESTSKSGVKLTDEIILEAKPYAPQLLTGELSRIVIDDTVITAEAGEIVKIRMRLERNSELVAELFLDSLQTALDTFLIDRRRFTYELVPGEGTNTLELTMTEENGDISKRTVIVEGVPGEVKDPSAFAGLDRRDDDTLVQGRLVEEPVGAETPVYINQDSINASLRAIIARIRVHANDSLLRVLSEFRPEDLTLQSTVAMLDSLGTLVDSTGLLPEELYTASGKAIIPDNTNILKEVLFDHADGNLRQYLDSLDAGNAGLKTVEALMEHLLEAASENNYSERDLREALAAGLENELSEAEMLKYSLMRTANSQLTDYLESLDLDERGISSETGFYRYLDQVTGKGAEELRMFLIDEGPESLSEFLTQLDLSAEGISSMSDLITYLLEHIDKTGISEEELMELITSFLEDALASFDQGDLVPEPVSGMGSTKTVLTILISSVALILIIFLVFRRRRKDKE